MQALAVSPAELGEAATAKAAQYLDGAQEADGGWALTPGSGSNSQSTAWAAQGLESAGVDPDSARNGGESGFDYLEARQARNGHYRYSRGSDQTPVWVTAQALLALERQPFPIAAVEREPAEDEGGSNNGSSDGTDPQGGGSGGGGDGSSGQNQGEDGEGAGGNDGGAGTDGNGNPQNSGEVRLEALRRWLNDELALSPFSGLNTIKAADFLRWRELSLTYRVPRDFAQRVNLRNLSFTIAGRNLALWTKYDGVDPELNALGRGAGSSLDQNFLDGIEAFGFAIPRRILFTMRMGF